MDFFYDSQVRRYLVQFMRIFSDIKIRTGPDASGMYTVQRVPIMYGDPSWMVAQIIKGASENTMLPNPMFSAYIDSVRISPERRQDTQYVGKLSTLERKFDQSTQTYSNEPGIRQDIERYMPVPYDLYVKLDVWTSNMNIKLQLFEQIGIIFNPSIQLQQNNNLLDWTSIFEVFLEDFTFSNRSIPQGSEDERDVMSYRFKIPIWINPPAKVKRSSLIAEIVTNVFYNFDVDQIRDKVDGKFYDPFHNGCIPGIPVQIITTEGNYRVSVVKGPVNDEVILLDNLGNRSTDNNWQSLIEKYGQISPNITKMRLKLDPDIDTDEHDIIGNIFQDPDRADVLFFVADQDTLPANTLPPIDSIIDPTESVPGRDLPVAAPGQRYLLTSAYSVGEEPAMPFGVSTSPWGPSVVAYPNDVIEYDGTQWRVIFDSRNSVGDNYLVNNSNGTQYRFDGNEWTYTYYGTYGPGYWRVDNIIHQPNGQDTTS